MTARPVIRMNFHDRKTGYSPASVYLDQVQDIKAWNANMTELKTSNGLRAFIKKPVDEVASLLNHMRLMPDRFPLMDWTGISVSNDDFDRDNKVQVRPRGLRGLN